LLHEDEAQDDDDGVMEDVQESELLLAQGEQDGVEEFVVFGVVEDSAPEPELGSVRCSERIGDIFGGDGEEGLVITVDSLQS